MILAHQAADDIWEGRLSPAPPLKAGQRTTAEGKFNPNKWFSRTAGRNTHAARSLAPGRGAPPPTMA